MTIDEPSAARRFGGLTVIQLATSAGALWIQFGDPLPWLRPIAAPIRLSAFNLALVIAICVAAISCLAVTGMIRSGFRERYPEFSGFVVFFSILLAIGQAILCAMTIRDIGTEKQIAAKAEAEMHRTVVTDMARRSMTLTGDIGPGLYDELVQFDAQVGGIRTFEIDSHGGLVEEALRIGHFLAAKRVAIIARNNCDSACVIVAIASPNAYADADMRFGFHRVTSILETGSELGELGRRRAQTDSNEFLLSHGVPGWIVDYSMTIPSWNLVYYQASALVSWHALAGTMNGDAVLSADHENDK